MASVAADLITYLDGLFSETAGTDLFEGPPTPEGPANVVVVSHYMGEPGEDRVMGPSLTPPGVEVSLVQVLVRNTGMATGKTKADAYHAKLDGYNGTLSGRKYFDIESINGMPFSMGQDKNTNWEWVCNYRCQHAR